MIVREKSLEKKSSWICGENAVEEVKASQLFFLRFDKQSYREYSGAKL